MSITAAEIQSQLKKKFPNLTTGSTIPAVEFTSTGYVGFDYLLGGGLPKGRIIEIIGATGTGKSSCVLAMVATLTKQQQLVYICDSENSIELGYLTRAGCDPDYVVIRPTTSLNDALEFYHTVLSQPETYNPGAFIFDTVKGFQPDAATTKLTNDAESHLMASAARVWSTHHGMLVDMASHSGATVFCCNHIMTSLSPYGSPISKPGGGTIPQVASLSLHIKGKGKKLDDDLKAMGPDYPGIMSVDIAVDKSRFGTFGRSITVDLTATGYDNITTLIRLAKGCGAIRATGAWYQLEFDGNSERTQGLAAMHKFLLERSDLVTLLSSYVLTTSK